MKSEVLKLLLRFICEDDSPAAEVHVVACDLPCKGIYSVSVPSQNYQSWKEIESLLYVNV